MKIRFWGVRGSLPTPLLGSQVRQKQLALLRALRDKEFDLRSADDGTIERALATVPFAVGSTYGGNTTCVEIRAGDDLIICDMGTGISPFGDALRDEMLANKGLHGTIIQSHVHWDHIQGLPFFGPLHVPREVVKNRFQFIGGKSWESDLEVVLRGQMHAPVFPVEFELIKQAAMQMDFTAIYDRWTHTVQGRSGPFGLRARVLNHPQQTFGYRVTAGSSVIAFTTDHEPYAAPDPNLIEIARGADVWITDCQYTYDTYVGKHGPPRLGWGHSFPEYIATTAKLARPQLIVTTHHDPRSTDTDIEAIARQVEALSGIRTVPAYEGLELSI